jgi:hypothetical protein
VSGCPDVVDYLGEERVLDHGLSDTSSDGNQGILQKEMLAWVESSDALVVGTRAPSWGPEVWHYVPDHFVADHNQLAKTKVYLRRPRRSV